MAVKKFKCKSCGKKFPDTMGPHILRLETADGLHEMRICDNCSAFWDLSAEVINKGRSDD